MICGRKNEEHLLGDLSKLRVNLSIDPTIKKIKKIILFGSVAKKEATSRSDIDIAIQLNRTTPKEAFLIKKRIMGSANKKVDIKILNVLPLKVKRNVIREGKVIYGNK